MKLNSGTVEGKMDKQVEWNEGNSGQETMEMDRVMEWSSTEWFAFHQQQGAADGKLRENASGPQFTTSLGWEGARSSLAFAVRIAQHDNHQPERHEPIAYTPTRAKWAI